jgi:hypothetical protein
MPAAILLYTKELLHHHAASFNKSRTDSAPIFKATETRHHQTEGYPQESYLQGDTTQPCLINEPHHDPYRQGRHDTAADTTEGNCPAARLPRQSNGSNHQPQQAPKNHEAEATDEQPGAEGQSRVNHEGLFSYST